VSWRLKEKAKNSKACCMDGWMDGWIARLPFKLRKNVNGSEVHGVVAAACAYLSVIHCGVSQ